MKTWLDSVDDLLPAINEGWKWKLGEALAIHDVSAFGNVIVENSEGHFFRIMPEELCCEQIAGSAQEWERLRVSPAFQDDWEMQNLRLAALGKLGALATGETYCLAVPGVLGGKYTTENLRKISLLELIGYAGDVSRQIDAVPDGGTVELRFKD